MNLNTFVPTLFFPQKLYTPVTNWAYCLIFKLLFVMGWAIICCIGDGLDSSLGAEGGCSSDGVLNTDFADYSDMLRCFGS